MQGSISVIVPVYKAEPFLHRCVESILSQTYTELDVVLVDDGSPDGCPALCDAYAAEDSRVQVVHKANGGLSSARNAGLRAAKGDWIMFVDADDWVAPDMAACLMEAARETEADIAECGYISFFNEARQFETLCTGKVTAQGSEEALDAIMGEQLFRSIVCNKLYTKRVAGEVYFPEGKMHEDEFVVHQYYLNARQVVFVDVAKYYYERRREDSITTARFSTARLDGCAALGKRMHLFWRLGLRNLEQRVDDRYAEVLFYRLRECWEAGVADEKLRTCVAEAQENWKQIQKDGRKLSPQYRPAFEALAQGWEAFGAYCAKAREEG